MVCAYAYTEAGEAVEASRHCVSEAITNGLALSKGGEAYPEAYHMGEEMMISSVCGHCTLVYFFGILGAIWQGKCCNICNDRGKESVS